MLRKKSTLILIVTLIVALVVVGCSSNSGNNNNKSSSSNTSGTQTQDQSKSGDDTPEKVTLRFSWWGNEVRHNATIDAINLYMDRNPHVEIKAEYRGKSERELIATGLVGGTVADIVQLNPPWMEDFTRDSDFFVDFYEKTDLIDLSEFDEQFLQDYGVYNDKLVGLPLGVNATIGIMNKDAAEKFGIPTSLDIEMTWEEYYEIGKTVNEQDPESYMLNQDTGGMVEFILKKYIIQKTGQFLIGDDYSLGFTREDLKEALAYIQKLYADKVAIPASDANVFNDATQTNPKWINGQAVQVFSWTSTVSPYTHGIDAEFVPFVLPVREGALDTSLVIKPPQVVAISKASKHIDEAVKFVDFLLNDIDAGMLLKDVRAIPAVKSVADAVGEAGLFDPVVVAGHNYGMANAGLYENGPSTNGEIVKALEDAVEIIAYPNQDLDKVVDDTLKIINDVIERVKNE